MQSSLHMLLLTFGLAAASITARAADNFPEFHGANGSGVAAAKGLPLQWSETQNVRWKTAIHDRGWSSPVVWGTQVWLTTATQNGRELFAVCLDRQSGTIVHDVKVFDVDKPEKIAPVNSYASPTPAIEAGRVYVHYGTYGTACLDTQTGKVLWTRRDLNCDHHEGPGASVAIWNDLLVFHVDGCDVQYAVALDKRTGTTVWKTPRSGDYAKIHKLTRKAYATPITVDGSEGPELVSPCSRAVFGYDPRTGAELWKVTHRGWSMAVRPLAGHGLVYAVVDYDRPELWAIRPGGRGEVTASHLAWKLTRGAPQKVSPALVADHLYLVNDKGVASCVDARAGTLAWQHRLGGDFSASLLAVEGRVYAFAHDGTGYVLDASPAECKVLATNRLEATIMASPAAVGKSLFVRSETHLYCIE